MNGSDSPGRGKWSKCGIFKKKFWNSAVTKRFDGDDDDDNDDCDYVAKVDGPASYGLIFNVI